MQKRIIIFIGIIFIIGIIFSLTYDPYLEKETPEITKKIDSPEEEFKDIKIKLIQNKNITWEMQSADIQRFTDKEVLKLGTVIVNAYNNNSSQLYSISADRGEYYLTGDKLILEGPVQINGNDIEMKMERLSYYQSKQEILGQGKVWISGPGYYIKGDKVLIKPDLEVVTIYGKKGKQASLHWEEDFH